MDSNLITEFSWNFVVDAHPVSTNDMYFHMPKKCKSNPNRYTTYSARTPELKKFQSVMANEVLPNLIPSDALSQFQSLTTNPEVGVSLVIVFLMPEDHYWDSDTSNYVKALEDCIVSYTKVDDNKNMIITLAKGLSSDVDWHTYIMMSTCPRISKDSYRLNHNDE